MKALPQLEQQLVRAGQRMVSLCSVVWCHRREQLKVSQQWNISSEDVKVFHCRKGFGEWVLSWSKLLVNGLLKLTKLQLDGTEKSSEAEETHASIDTGLDCV